ncbi:MAG TPA: hypothetical protein VNW06_00370 [Cytophagaceae bacterium]|nr:hypothetical protein [Cytophagaceae bacterium]
MASLKLSDSTKGVIVTLILSFSFLLLFFCPILQNPNQYYFSSSGDGLQIYFEALYHTKYDTLLLHQQSINYPYGESVFFTACMPAITNSIIILKPIIDLSDYTVGIINLLILLSIPISAVFLFLIFQQLTVNWIYSVFIATGIAYLSPQIDRISGHLVLAFQFSIPAYIYLMSLFYKNPTLKKSLLIGILVFLIASQHLYFFGFTALISCIFFGVLFIRKEKIATGKPFIVLAFLIQTILPYLCLQSILFFSDNVPDRTNFPWGYLVYKANPTSIFFPSGQVYESFVRLFITPENYEWEGKAYIGIAGIIAFISILILPIKNFIQRKYKVTGDPFLDILLLASLLALLISFGYPFLDFEYLLKYSGPIKQMRGIGRFSWIFFYTINIVAFYLLFQWTKNKSLLLRLFIYSLSIGLLYTEAYPSMVRISNNICNKIPELEDKNNILPNDQWITSLSKTDYQAILPLPYFHIGSENTTIVNHTDILKYSYIVALKTGLPLYAVSSSRTSLSQTYRNISLVTDNSFLPELPPLIPGKPFLVLCKKENLKDEELLLYRKSISLFKTKDYEILKLYPESINEIFRERKNILMEEYTKEIANSKNALPSILYTYEGNSNQHVFEGKGALEFSVDEHKILYDSIIPFQDTCKTFTFSFWMYNFKKDLYPRTSIEISQSDSTQNRYIHYTTNPLWIYKQFNKDWTLIEFPFTLQNKNDKLKVVIFNNDLLPKNKIIIDNLMIKPAYTNVYHLNSMYLSKNNRYYSVK